nr:DHH family phosphoesterase [Acetatifactor sp.]
MKKKVTVRGTIKSYLHWPLIMIILPLLMSIHAYMLTSSKQVGQAMILYTLFYCVVAVILYVHYRNRISPSLVRYAASYGKVQKQLLREMELPLGVLDIEGHLLWANDEFVDIIHDEKAARKDINNVIPELTKAFFPQGELDEELHFTLEDRSYRAVLRRIVLEEDAEENAKGLGRDLEKLCDNSCLINLYLYDETEILQYIQENREQKMVSGLIYIDNYEEALESMDEVKRSLLVALVDRKVSKYMQEIDAIVRKMEKDKYFVVFQQKYLAKLQGERFSILEDVRSISRGNDMAVTVSIGIGVNEDSYLGSYEAARAAIDLALGRGGDQAVVKEREKISYYGGKSMQVEKNTRVKARVKAHALKELVEAKDEVVVMGHSVGDVDCFGAAVGIYRIAKALGKRAYIVINEITASVRANAERIQNSPDYEEDIIINGARAKEIVNNDTLLVVVDVNRPSYTECPDLLHQTQTVVILDHHRKTGEAIDNAVLSYIEPYASSACEMVAEILQYIDDGIKLKPVEADAMYAGIMIDTNNFLTKTGVRT